MSSANQSCAHMVAIATFENPRPVPQRPNMMAFDIQVYLGASIMNGVVKYYNANGYRFEETGAFIMRATIARIGPNSQIISNSLENTDYAIEGDIQWLYVISQGPTMKDWKDSVKINQLPYLTISGQAIRRNASEFKFDVDVEQWTSFGRALSPFPVTATVPKSNKYRDQNKRPMPGEKAFISMSGPMTKFIGAEPFTRRFGVEVDKITFLCRAGSTKGSKDLNDEQPVATDSTKKMKIDFTKLFDTGFSHHYEEPQNEPEAGPSTSSSQPAHQSGNESELTPPSSPTLVTTKDAVEATPISGKRPREANDDSTGRNIRSRKNA